MTKNEMAMYRAFATAPQKSIYEVYGRLSTAKIRAWESIREECYVNGGSALRVVSHNTFMFTCAYVYPDPETGALRLMYHTPSSRYDIDLTFSNSDDIIGW